MRRSCCAPPLIQRKGYISGQSFYSPLHSHRRPEEAEAGLGPRGPHLAVVWLSVAFNTIQDVAGVLQAQGETLRTAGADAGRGPTHATA